MAFWQVSYLGYAGSDHTNAHFGHQLDTDACIGIGTFEIVDQFGQILNGIDIVMRWWGDKAHSRHRFTSLGNILGHLVARQLTTLSRLGTLRHLDL